MEDLGSAVAATGADVQGRTSIGAKKLRILMVGMHLTKTRGGITTLTAGILNSGLSNEYEINYIASQAEDYGRLRKLILAIGALIQFIVSALISRPGLVYVHMGSNASLYRESVFGLIGKLLKKRVLIHFHAGDLDNYYPHQSSFGRRFIAYSLGMSDRVIAVSLESADQLRKLRPDLKISVIQNAIDTGEFRKRESGNAENSNIVRLLFVGAIGKLKGERDLIAAIESLKNDLPELKVSILGYGAENLRELCEERGVANQIEHLGAVSLSQRIAFYERSDIFVLPTYAEAMPMSVIEAMAAGLPVITTRVGGIPELIDDEKEGLLFEPGDVAALAQKILILANDKNARLAMGKRARQRVDEQMSFSKYIERLRNEITTVCELEK